MQTNTDMINRFQVKKLYMRLVVETARISTLEKRNTDWMTEKLNILKVSQVPVMQGTSDFRLPTSDFRLRTSDFGLPTSDFKNEMVDFLTCDLLTSKSVQSLNLHSYVSVSWC